MTDPVDDLKKRLRDYQRWMKDGCGKVSDGPIPSISIDDIDGDETFGAAADKLEQQAKEIEALRKGYTECIEDMADWAAYAGDYFRQKNDIDGDMKRHQANLSVIDTGCPRTLDECHARWLFPEYLSCATCSDNPANKPSVCGPVSEDGE